MKTIIIRDDDTSYFTPPDLLEAVYARLWARSIPVALAVVPAARGDVRVMHREGQPFDPAIPTQHRGDARGFPLAENKALCRFLNDQAAAGRVEICLHGYDHSYHEFDSQDEGLLREKITRGLAELRAALPAATIRTFIAPYDRLSDVAFQLLTNEFGLTVCTSTASLKATPYHDLVSYRQLDLRSGQRLFTCDEYFFTRHELPEKCLMLAQQRLSEEQLVIVTNHYWTFFYDWSAGWPAMQAAWEAFIDDVLGREDVQFVTFA
ncbi:MAG: hypothetical protein OHK0046_33610 [Anaerolineae bacterium]